MTDEQLKGYFKAVEEARDTKTLKSVLPLDLLPCYEEIMQKIIQSLKQSLDYYESYEDSEDLLQKIDGTSGSLSFVKKGYKLILYRNLNKLIISIPMFQEIFCLLKKKLKKKIVKMRRTIVF